MGCTVKAAPEYVLVPDVGIGKVVAVFADGAWARDHLACWACDGQEPMRGYDDEMPLEDGRIFMVQMGDRSRAMVAESDADAATALQWEAAKAMPMPAWEPDKVRIVSRSKACRSCDGTGDCSRCHSPRKCIKCGGRGILLEPETDQQVLPFENP